MQELFDWANQYKNKMISADQVVLKAYELLEKEKEQIIDFCWECLRGDNIYTITSNKELIEYINNRYNQTYNQNK